MNEPAIDCWQRNLAVCLFGAFTTVFAMTLILPFLPVYIGQLGVSGHAAIVQWSGIAYAATFVTAGLVAPLWGMLGDRYGRKPMLVRASLGMAITMLLICLLYTSDAADEGLGLDVGGRRLIQKNTNCGILRCACEHRRNLTPSLDGQTSPPSDHSCYTDPISYRPA
ncbi:MFS transporter, partial [Klebsiella quasipneumoniae subsp. similipneumoniae]|nr:MFS transporter [Klebsiella quasipneumoniae subsp. similipneumoniae]